MGLTNDVSAVKADASKVEAAVTTDVSKVKAFVVKEEAVVVEFWTKNKVAVVAAFVGLVVGFVLKALF